MSTFSIIRYVTHIPSGNSSSRETFEEYKKYTHNEKVLIHLYQGPLSQEEIDTLHNILYGAQRSNEEVLSKLDREKLPRLFPIIEEMVDKGVRLNQHGADAFSERVYTGNIIPASYYYEGEYSTVFPLAPSLPGTKALIFINDELRGQLLIEETRRFNDQWAGWTTEGIGKIYVDDYGKFPEKIIGEIKWNSWWSDTSVLAAADRKIREYLGETELIFF